LWRTHKSASSGSSAQSFAGGGNCIRLNTETWTVVSGFLDRLRAVAVGCGGHGDGINDRDVEGRILEFFYIWLAARRFGSLNPDWIGSLISTIPRMMFG
jgi:hypothetical protein